MQQDKTKQNNKKRIHVAYKKHKQQKHKEEEKWKDGCEWRVQLNRRTCALAVAELGEGSGPPGVRTPLWLMVPVDSCKSCEFTWYEATESTSQRILKCSWKHSCSARVIRICGNFANFNEFYNGLERTEQLWLKSYKFARDLCIKHLLNETTSPPDFRNSSLDPLDFHPQMQIPGAALPLSSTWPHLVGR